MPLPNFTQFQAQPDLLLNWLRGNLLLAGYVANVPNPPGTGMVTIAAPPAVPGIPNVAINESGVPMDVFRITNAGVNPGNQLPSYICNYLPNTVHSVDIGGLGDFCFTVTLNGCTFGIGPAGIGGARRVAHANRGGNTLLQRGQIQGAFGVGPNLAGLTLLEPAQYRRLSDVLNMQATVFGIRTATNWRFYFQAFSTHGAGNYRVYGVYPIQ